MSAQPSLTPASVDLTPDLDEARRFLACLDPAATGWTFQTFTDGKRDNGQVLHGTLDEHAAELTRLQSTGAGVFVTINRTDLKGRATKNIEGVRALIADLDNVPLENKDRLPLTPHMVVNSSPGKWHVYWRTLGVTRERFTPIQTALNKLLGSDPKVKDLSRVMRLPGFWHLKDRAAPHMVRVQEVNDGRRYSLSDMSMLTSGAHEGEGNRAPTVVGFHPAEQEAKARELAGQAAGRTNDDTALGRHSVALDLGWRLKEAGVSKSVAASVAVPLFAVAVRSTNSDGDHAPYDRERARQTILNAYAAGKEAATPSKNAADAGHPRRVVNHAAAMAVLRSDPKLRDLIGFDEMQRTEVLMQPVPGSRYRLDGTQELRDHDVAALLEYLQHNGMERLPLETLWKAVGLRARECAFHPIKQYLNGLSWDGVERLPTWLNTYLGTEDSEYTRTIGRLFMIALVARVMKPGCKADYMMILEGVQSATKSTACGILGGEWFSDQLPDVRGDKDASQHLKGKWLIEVSELSSMSKADTNALKAFITRSTERYRPSYARKEVSEPRQCLFIGTTNKAAYLKDETGGRRFWPVKVADRINLDGLRAARDQLFAEALARFKRNEPWWPDRDVEATVIQPQQEARYEADIWEEQVEAGLLDSGRDRVTLLDVAVEIIGLSPDRCGTGANRRLGPIMERLGWVRAPKGSKGERWWVPGPGWSGKKLTDSAGDRPAFRPPATVTAQKIEAAF